METTMIVELCCAVLTCSAFGAYVAAQKNRPCGEGWLFGLVLGPFGVIAEACLPMGTEREDAIEQENILRAKGVTTSWWYQLFD